MMEIIGKPILKIQMHSSANKGWKLPVVYDKMQGSKNLNQKLLRSVASQAFFLLIDDEADQASLNTRENLRTVQ